MIKKNKAISFRELLFLYVQNMQNSTKVSWIHISKTKYLILWEIFLIKNILQFFTWYTVSDTVKPYCFNHIFSLEAQQSILFWLLFIVASNRWESRGNIACIFWGNGQELEGFPHFPGVHQSTDTLHQDFPCIVISILHQHLFKEIITILTRLRYLNFK